MAGPSTHPSEDVIDLHNEMVLKISKEISPRNLPDWDDLLGLFKDNPLTPVDIEGLKNIQGLFDLLMKYGKIDYGNYEFFVRKADNVNKRVVNIVKKYMDDIENLDGPSFPKKTRAQKDSKFDRPCSKMKRKQKAPSVGPKMKRTKKDSKFGDNSESSVGANCQSSAMECHQTPCLSGNHIETTKQKYMIESTEAMVDKQSTKSKFIETAAFRKAKEKLSTNGVVVIKGNTGDGKTRLAIQLLSWLMKPNNARRPLELHDLSDWNDTVSPNQSLAVFIDDIFHDDAFRQVNKSIWQKKEKHLSSTFSTGVNSNVLIVTVRNDDFSSLNLELSRFFQAANIIDLSTTDAISEQDKLDLLEIYKPDAQNFEPFSNKEIKDIVKYAPLLGFPQCCVLYRDLALLQPQRVKFFRNPYDFMKTALSKLDSGRCAALLYLFLCGGEVLEKDLDPNNDKIDKTILDEVFDIDLVEGKSKDQLGHKKKITFLMESLEHMSSSLVTKKKLWRDQAVMCYSFSHDSVKDTVALLYGKITPIGFIQNCPYNSLYYITTSKDTTNKRVTISDSQYMHLMYKRLLRELGSKCPKNYRIIASLHIWNEDKFARGFFRWLDDEGVDQDFFLNWTTENDTNIRCLCDWPYKKSEFHDRKCRISFLVHVAYSDNYCLLKKLVERAPNNHPQLQYALYSMIIAKECSLRASQETFVLLHGKITRCIFVQSCPIGCLPNITTSENAVNKTSALLRGKIIRSVFLQSCPIGCLPNITTSENAVNKTVIEHDNVDMYKRLLRELESKKSETYRFIAGLDIWKDDRFALGFLRWLNEEGIDQDFFLNWTTENDTNIHCLCDWPYKKSEFHDRKCRISFLVHVAYSDNYCLLKKLVERTPNNHPQLQYALYSMIIAKECSLRAFQEAFAQSRGEINRSVFVNSCPIGCLPNITTSGNAVNKTFVLFHDEIDRSVFLQSCPISCLPKNTTSENTLNKTFAQLHGKINSSVFLQSCPICFLTKIATSENAVDKTVIEHDVVDLYKRLLRELERKKSDIYRFIAGLDIWKDNRFVLGFLGWLVDLGIDKDFHLNRATEEDEIDKYCSGIFKRHKYFSIRVDIKFPSLLIYVAHTDNIFLLEKLVERTPIDHVQLQHALFTVIESDPFSNSSVRERIALLYSRVTQRVLILKCPRHILSYITTSKNMKRKLVIKPDNVDMYTRLLRELENENPKNYKSIAALEIWKENQFVPGFFRWLDNAGIDKYFHLNWTTEDVERCKLYHDYASMYKDDKVSIQSPSFLVYVAYTDNFVLLEKLVERTPEDHPQLQSALLSVITSKYFDHFAQYYTFNRVKAELLFRKITPIWFIQNCPCKCLHFITTARNISYKKAIAVDNVDMYKRLLRELESKHSENYRYIARLEIWKDNKFVLGFLEWLDDEKNYKAFHLQWTTEDVERNKLCGDHCYSGDKAKVLVQSPSFLVYLAHTDNLFLLSKILDRTPVNHVQLRIALLSIKEYTNSAKDRISILFCKMSKTDFIKNCPCDRLHYITTYGKTIKTLVVAHADVDMYKRVLKELQSKRYAVYKCIAALDIWKDNQFVLGFLEWLENEGIDKYFHLNWTTEDVEKYKQVLHADVSWGWYGNTSAHTKSPSFLVYVADTGNLFLLEKLVERTPEDHPQLQTALFSVMKSRHFNVEGSSSCKRDREELLFRRITPIWFIQNCSCCSLDFITTSPNIRYKKAIAPDNVDMYKRLLRELESKHSKNYRYIAKLDIWKDNKFVLGFLKWLDDEKTDKAFHLQWTTEDVERYKLYYDMDSGYDRVLIQSPSFLVYVAHALNLVLLDELVERTPENHVQLQCALFTVIGRGQSYVESSQDRISRLLRKVTKSVFIKKCPSDCLHYITTSADMINKLVVEHDDVDMYKCLLKELESKWSKVYKCIAALDIWEDNRFLLGFLGWLENEEIDKDFHLNWTTGYVGEYNHADVSWDWYGNTSAHTKSPSFLVYVADTGNLFLLEKLVEKTPEDHPQLQTALFTVIKSPYFNDQRSSIYRDRAEILFRRITPICFIQNCPRRYLHFITTARNISYKKAIAVDNVDMFKRLLRELESTHSKNYRYIAELDIWKDDEFVLGFIRWIDDEGIHKDFHLKWTTDVGRDGFCHFYMDGKSIFEEPNYMDEEYWDGEPYISLSFLVYVAHSDNLSFLHKLLKRTPKNHAQLQFVMFGVVREGHLDVLDKLIDWGTPPTCFAMSSNKLTDVNYNIPIENINVLVEACLYEREEMVKRLTTSFPFLVHDMCEFEGYILYIAAVTGNCSLYKTVEAAVFPDISREERAHRLCEMADDHEWRWTVLHAALCRRDSNESLTLYLLSNYPELTSARDNEGWHCLHHIADLSNKDLFIKVYSHLQNYYKEKEIDFDITTVITNNGDSVLDVAKKSHYWLYRDGFCNYLSQFWPQTSDSEFA